MAELKSYSAQIISGIFRKYLLFLSLGLIYFLFKMLIAPAEIIDDFLRVFLLNLLFLSLIFFIDWIVAVYVRGVFIQLVIVYFLAGFCGLFLIDWLVFGNYEINNVIGQLFMFSYWSGIAVFPKLITRNKKREGFYLDMIIWIGSFFGIFISLGGLAYFFLQRGVFWQVAIMLFFITLNLYYWHEFLLLRKEEKEEKEKEKVIQEYLKDHPEVKTSGNGELTVEERQD